METSSIGGKILYLLTAVLTAAMTAAGTYLYQADQKDEGPDTSERSVQNETPQEPDEGMSQNTPDQPDQNTYTLEDGVTITLIPGLKDGKISSPLTIQGNVPSSAEKARYTIRLTDPDGNVLVNSSMSVSGAGSGSTSNFKSTLKFDSVSSGQGSLQIISDSPSVRTITIPVIY